MDFINNLCFNNLMAFIKVIYFIEKMYIIKVMNFIKMMILAKVMNFIIVRNSVVKYGQSLTKSGYLLSIKVSSSWWIVKLNQISSNRSNQFLILDDRFHQGEESNQVSQVHQTMTLMMVIHYIMLINLINIASSILLCYEFHQYHELRWSYEFHQRNESNNNKQIQGGIQVISFI